MRAQELLLYSVLQLSVTDIRLADNTACVLRLQQLVKVFYSEIIHDLLFLPISTIESRVS